MKKMGEWPKETDYFSLSDLYFLKGEGLADAREQLKCWEALLKVANRGLQHYPNSMLLKKQLGVALIKLDRLTEAVDVFRELIANRNLSIYNYDLACAYARMYDLTGCLKALARAIELEEYYRKHASVDPDFENVWDSPLFQALIYQSGPGMPTWDWKLN